jgi:methylated-DNA-[protein]-cysteine S-methyltransferase
MAGVRGDAALEDGLSAVAWTRISSPIGELVLVGDDAGLRELRFGIDPRPPDPLWVESAIRFRRSIRQLEEYFRGERRRFAIPLAPSGTPFQKRVWDEVARIPYGTTIAYAELARRLGAAGAARAAGAANGRNPLPILVPCHRVLGSDGTLTGYAGGLDAKRRLLELEGLRPSPAAPRARSVQRWPAIRSP